MANSQGTDLAQLEYEFATNPTSEAFIPLAEAYLGMGRFVEAMVVCKKGIKAHPELPTGRLIMARIYSDQAKHQKAIEELEKLLKLNPDQGDALRLLGRIYLKLGREEDGVSNLKRALDADPDDREARESLLKIGIDYVPTAQAPAQPTTEPSMAVQSAAQQASARPMTGGPTSEAPTERAMPVVATGPQAYTNSQPPVVAQQFPTAAPRPAPGPRAPQRKRIADIYQEMADANAKPKRTSIKVTLYMGGALALGLIIYVLYTWQAGLKQERINKLLEDGRSLFNQDSYSGYKQALDKYLEIVREEDSHEEALARSAFIAAVLHGEYEETSIKIKDKTYKMIDKGAEMLGKGMSRKYNSAMLVAARALLSVYGGGSTNDAIGYLEQGLRISPDSAVIHTTFGLILTNKGNLEEARDHLEKGAGQSDIRALVGMGDWAIRKSMYQQAVQAYNRAIQIDRSHIRAVLGKTLAALAWGDKLRHTKEAKDNLARFKGELVADSAASDKVTADFIEAVIKVRDSRRRTAPLKALRDFLKGKGAKPIFQFIAAREHRRNNKLKDARELIGHALRMDSSRPDFLLEEAMIILAQRDWEGARSRALRLQETDPECGRCILIVGDAYMGEKKTEQARKAYHEATKLNDIGFKGEAHLRLADLYHFLEQFDREQAQLELAFPNLRPAGERRLAAVASFRLSSFYAGKQRKAEFFNILKQAMEADPTYGPPYCMLGVNINTGSAEGRSQAKELCKKCIELETTGHYTGNCKEVLKKSR